MGNSGIVGQEENSWLQVGVYYQIQVQMPLLKGLRQGLWVRVTHRLVV